jgi:hypothetical protein
MCYAQHIAITIVVGSDMGTSLERWPIVNNYTFHRLSVLGLIRSCGNTLTLSSKVVVLLIAEVFFLQFIIVKLCLSVLFYYNT